MSEALKPCLHCGATEGPIVINVHDFDDEQAKLCPSPFHVLCVECGIRTQDCKTEEEAIAAWNRQWTTRRRSTRMRRSKIGLTTQKRTSASPTQYLPPTQRGKPLPGENRSSNGRKF